MQHPIRSPSTDYLTMAHLFAYGTLMVSDIMRAVAGGYYEREPAELAGYARKRVTGEEYPAITQRRGASVQGVVYRDLPASAVDRLDRFEGSLYRRMRVTLRDARGMTLAADAYVLSPAALSRLSDDDWSLEVFLASGKQKFLRAYGWFEM